MDSTNWISKKIAILGSHAVGKTSLISRFVYHKFPENYLTTIGLKVDKKTVEIDDYRIDMVIWDIAGQDNMARIPHYYLNGCSGVIFVYDLSRPLTYENLESQLSVLKGIVGEKAEILIAGNKSDLLTEEEIAERLNSVPAKTDMVTSAKMGNNVEALFHTLARKLVKGHEH